MKNIAVYLCILVAVCTSFNTIGENRTHWLAITCYSKGCTNLNYLKIIKAPTRAKAKFIFDKYISGIKDKPGAVSCYDIYQIKEVDIIK